MPDNDPLAAKRRYKFHARHFQQKLAARQLCVFSMSAFLNVRLFQYGNPT
jgi:hypothetical protein